jgi:poly-beta-1,6-N-acetyl-D-glucosamine synthase
MTDQLETVRRTLAGARTDAPPPASEVETWRAPREPGDGAATGADGASGGGMHASYTPRTPRRGPGEEGQRRFYVSVRTKFLVAGALALGWVGFSLWLALPWIHSTSVLVGPLAAMVLIALIALIPGGLVAFLVVSLLLDRQPRLSVEHPTTGVTVLIAARNEAEGIGQTIAYLATQDCDGPCDVILVDNGSTDDTVEVARVQAAAWGLPLTILKEPRQGKNNALNTGLRYVRTPLVITVDADTVLHRSAVRLLLARYESSPHDVVAVAGSVLVRNSRQSFWARVQEWDYFLGIASVKRMQGLYQGTLVAQGAFSLYETDAVRLVGGWPDAIGEDIVLTWKLLRLNCRVFYEPLAVAFTSAPEDVRSFGRQRTRWARGVIEGLRTVPPWKQPRRMARVLTAVDMTIPFLDTAYIIAWLPGLVFACFGVFWLIGPMTIAVLPLTALAYGILFHRQWHHVFKPLGLQVRKNWLALVAFLFVYQILMSLASVRGYAQELLGVRRIWK